MFLGGNHSPTRHTPPLPLFFFFFFFHQNDLKVCSLDYIDGYFHFLFGLGSNREKISRGW